MHNQLSFTTTQSLFQKIESNEAPHVLLTQQPIDLVLAFRPPHKNNSIFGF